MEKLTGQAITAAALKLLLEHPGGMRFKQLVNAIQTANPETSPGHVFTVVSMLKQNKPDTVTRPSRGLYQLAEFAGKESGESEEKTFVPSAGGLAEENFYKSFAVYLTEELGEATIAKSLGW